MSEFNIHAAMYLKDSELFYNEDYTYTALETHVVKAAAFLDLHDTLITYNPNDWVRPTAQFHRYVELDNYRNFEPNEMVPAHILDVAKFRTEQPELYDKLARLHVRARGAACSAVVDLWIEKAPLQYLDFSNSGLTLKDFMNDQQTKGRIK